MEKCVTCILSSMFLLVFTLDCLLEGTSGLGVAPSLSKESLSQSRELINKRKMLNVSRNVDTSDKLSGRGSSARKRARPTAQIEVEMKAAVWCYCNRPECVPSGYMCESSEGRACFSKRIEPWSSSFTSSSSSSFSSRFLVGGSILKGGRQQHLLHHFATDPLTRGCVEMLTESERAECFHYLVPPSPTPTVLPLDKGRPRKTDRDTPTPSPPIKVPLTPAYTGLQCCAQHVCNYELAAPILIKEVKDDTSRPIPLEVSWWTGTPILVSVSGAVILVFLVGFARRILINGGKEHSGGRQFGGQNASRDVYIKVPYYIERTTPLYSFPEEGGRGGGRCSVLCAKSLQKRQDVADYCRFHPLSSTSNRHSMSCPSSLSSCPTLSPTLSPTSGEVAAARKEELEPLTAPCNREDDTVYSPSWDERSLISSSHTEDVNTSSVTIPSEADFIDLTSHQKDDINMLTNHNEKYSLNRPSNCPDQVQNLLLNS